jgi:hypothetical protein
MTQPKVANRICSQSLTLNLPVKSDWPLHGDTNIQNLRPLFFNHFQILTPESPKSLRYPRSRTALPASPHTGCPMSTQRQIEANRRNSQKSTGPTSVTGKAVSSMNSLKTGIHAKSLVLPSENLADLDQLIDEFYHHHHPSTPDARTFVDDLIYCEWSLRRLRAAETQAWQYQNNDIYRDPEKYPLGKSATCNPNCFSKIQYRLDATRRARLRALQALDKLRAEAAPAPVAEPDPPALEPPSLPPSSQTTSPQIGFVLPTPIPAPGTDKTGMNFRRSLPEIRCQSCLSPAPGPNQPAPIGRGYAQIR